MSSVLHPVGPEEPRTYWVRRAVVLVVGIVLIALLVSLLTRAFGGGDEAAPAAPSSAAPSVPAAASSGINPTTTSSATPTASPTTDGPSSPAASSPATPGAPTACAAGDLRVTIDGPSTAQTKKPVNLTVSVINQGSGPCKLTVSGKNAEVRVFSGTDRIFTTKHCGRWQPEVAKTVASQKSASWVTRWGVNRTAADCTVRSGTLQPGTYVATVELDGVKTAQHVMRVTT